MNLSKVRRHFSFLSYLIAREEADTVGGGRIYVTTVYVGLMYGLKSWVWTSSMLNTICGFDHCKAWWLADKQPEQLQNSIYVYYSTDEVLKFCRLRPVQVCIA